MSLQRVLPRLPSTVETFTLFQISSFYSMWNNNVLCAGIIWRSWKPSYNSWCNSVIRWMIPIKFWTTYSFDGLLLMRLATHDMAQAHVPWRIFSKQGCGTISLISITYVNMYMYRGQISKFILSLNSFHGGRNRSSSIFFTQKGIRFRYLYCCPSDRSWWYEMLLWNFLLNYLV